nr:head GIN domain-containing protein [uncultured Chitinophaga sp.]
MQTKITLCCVAVTLAIAGLFSACIGQNRVKGSGNVIKEERNAPSFHKIKVEGSMNVFLSQGPAKKAVIEAEDNIAPLVELVEDGDRLKVRFRHNTNISTRKSVNIYLTTPDVEEVSLAGSGDMKLVDKFNSKEEMKISLSGSGNMNGTINAPEVKASIAGSGNMYLQGETKTVNVSIAGSGDYVGDGLLSEEAEVKIAGSGDASVHASVKLEAKIAGSGDVKYKGNPTVSSSVAGSGSVKKI